MTTKTLKKRAEKASKREERQVKPSKEDLRVSAYYRWISRGCPPGDAITDWLAVEEGFEEEAKTRSAHDF